MSVTHSGDQAGCKYLVLLVDIEPDFIISFVTPPWDNKAKFSLLHKQWGMQGDKWHIYQQTYRAGCLRCLYFMAAKAYASMTKSTDTLLDPKTASKRADCGKALEEIMDRSY